MGVTNDSSASNSSAATDVGLAPYKMAAPPLSLAPFADGGDDERVESPDSPVSVAIDEVDDSSMQKQLFGFDGASPPAHGGCRRVAPGAPTRPFLPAERPRRGRAVFAARLTHAPPPTLRPSRPDCRHHHHL